MTEIWKDIDNYKGLYQVSNLGKVRSLDREVRYKGGWKSKRSGRVLKQATMKSGYKTITLKKDGGGDTFLVHRLVLITFKGTLLNYQVNHKDGNKGNNNLINLEWMTGAENTRHAVDNNLNCYGERHGGSKLKESEVKEILYGHKGLTQQEIADIYGVAQTTISMIRTSTNWKHLK